MSKPVIAVDVLCLSRGPGGTATPGLRGWLQRITISHEVVIVSPAFFREDERDRAREQLRKLVGELVNPLVFSGEWPRAVEILSPRARRFTGQWPQAHEIGDRF